MKLFCLASWAVYPPAALPALVGAVLPIPAPDDGLLAATAALSRLLVANSSWLINWKP